MSGISRRGFMKSAGVSAAGITLATKFSPFAYAANEKVRVGCIGCGGQGTYHIRDGLRGAEDIVIVAVCDVFLPHQKDAVRYGTLSNAGINTPPGWSPKDMTDEDKAKASEAFRPTPYYDYKEMLAKEELDAVVISTPLHTHFAIAMDCLNAGKWVFCEKTLCMTIEQSRQIVEKCHETGKFCAVGHQRRNNPKYNLAMDLVFGNQRKIGRINYIETYWHRNHYWRRQIPEYTLNDQEKQYITDLERHLNWRMYNESSGGLFTELATHQTDIANWFMMGVPKTVYAVGGIDYWRDGREVDDNIQITYVYEQDPSSPGFMPIDKRSQLQSLSKINKGYEVRMSHSNILANAKKGSSEMLMGDYGTLVLSEQDCTLFAEDAYTEKPAAEAGGEVDAITSMKSLKVSTEALLKGYPLVEWGTKHSADVYQFQAFAKHIREGGVPRNNQMVGHTTTITAIAAMESRKTGKPVEVDKAWYTFDFETPSFYAYEWDPSTQNDPPAGTPAPGAAPDSPAAPEPYAAPDTAAPAAAEPASA